METLKYTTLAKKGDMIRAYDFKPSPSRPACYIEGVVLETKSPDVPWAAYKVQVTKQVFAGQESSGGPHVISYVPHQVLMEYDNRVTKMERA